MHLYYKHFLQIFTLKELKDSRWNFYNISIFPFEMDI